MANGFKVFSVGEVLTAADVNDYLMEQSIGIFADSTARDAQITSPIEGQFCYLADSNVLQFYNGSSWASFIGEGDITGVTITTAGTSGLSGGATATSGAFSSTLVISPNSATSATVAGSDIVLIGDADDSNNLKKTTAQDIANLAPAGGLTEIDSFTITSNVTGNGDLTSNWQRSTASGFAKLGTGMAETGGIFTFPSTGFYEVEAIIFFESRSAAFPQIQIQVTTDNSSYSTALTIFGGERANQGGTGVTHSGTTFVDVTDTTQVKVKFTSANLDSSNVIDASNTIFNFKRLADT